MDSAEVVNVYRRVDGGGAPDEAAIWTSFLPGWPDGSFGWAKVDQHLQGVEIGPRLYVEYVGHGESDKPADYPLWDQFRIYDTIVSKMKQDQLTVPGLIDPLVSIEDFPQVFELIKHKPAEVVKYGVRF